jgi:hypothetical protein
MNAFSVGYEDVEYEMQPHTQDPYPTWTRDRGQELVDQNPWTRQELEVNPQVRMAPGKSGHSSVDPHRIEGQYLPVGRVLTHPSRIVAPLLLDSNQPQTFDVPAYIISWAPNPIVQHSYGQHTLAPNDMRHVVPKQLIGYSYDALSQDEIAEEAALRVRRAMYGK